MTRSTEPLDVDADVRGRTVVWSAGSVCEGRSPRVRHPLVRRLGLVLLAAAAVFSLAYAVHAWVVISPPPAGPAVPLWLPEQLPAEVGDDASAPRPTVHPTSVQPPVEAQADTSSSRETTDRGQSRTTDDHGVTTGHRSTSSPSSRSSSSANGSAGSGRPAPSGHSSGGSSAGGSSGSSRSGRGGSDDQATDDRGSSSGSGHGSNSGSEHSASGHGGSGHGSDDGGSHGSGGSGGSGGSTHGGDDS